MATGLLVKMRSRERGAAGAEDPAARLTAWTMRDKSEQPSPDGGPIHFCSVGSSTMEPQVARALSGEDTC